MSEAAAALASDRAARFISGGTLLMRAINEGDTSIATLVRSTDAAYRQIRSEGARIDIGAGARMVDILANRDLAFLHPAARIVGGPAVRAMATVGGNLFAPLALWRPRNGAAGARRDCQGAGRLRRRAADADRAVPAGRDRATRASSRR